ncbi:MAG: hypothetical protein O7D86_00805 [Proteobacteria bacterium]|nr:hypothetical protein [Pseudomonadota bacterium]
MKPVYIGVQIPMNFRAFSGLFLIVLITLLTACNAYQLKKKANNLDDTITSYSVALRWAEYQDLYSYYVSPNGTQPPADLDSLQHISVTGVDVKEKIINEDHTKGNVKITVTYYIKEPGSIKKLKLNQKWWYNELNKQWFIDGEFPRF